MSLSKNRALMIPLKPESYKTTDQFIKQWLMQKRIDERSSFETMLLFESLFQDMIEQGYGQDTILTITLYLKAAELILIAIFAEVFFGWLQNIINVLGDIVSVAIEEQKARQQLAS